HLAEHRLLLPTFFFSCSRDPRALHSFPTRRSSDLIGEVTIGHAPRLGEFGFQENDASEVQKNDDAVEGVILMLRGEQTQNVLKADRKSTRLNSSHVKISYAVFCLKKKKKKEKIHIY